ncbi:Ca(2+)-dependent cysteine protease [Coemansia aciculifera]|uniref:Ca(2+)-dependent cysteine protease n=1 Tax=Coemansia aciculifera TaxID=417176 RepID=A0ACC1M2Y6_9FUNG|nr:Ca(2+)-dependent cysteine protease [Coemansia aciculifera]
MYPGNHNNRRSGEYGNNNNSGGNNYGNNTGNYGYGNEYGYAPPSGPPPGDGYGNEYGYAPPLGPPPPSDDYGYAPPSGPPPPGDDYYSSRGHSNHNGGSSNYNNGGDNYNRGGNNYNSGGSYNDGYAQGGPPQQGFPGQGGPPQQGFPGQGGPSPQNFPGQGYARSDNYGPGPGSASAGRGSGRQGFPGEGYASPGGSSTYSSNQRFPGEGYGGSPAPPGGGGYNSMPSGGSGYNSMPGSDYGIAPPANMPVAQVYVENIDFAGSQFPTWNTHTPTPPPPFPSGQSGAGSGYAQPTHGDIPTYNIPQEIQQQASKVALSNCRGRKRALLIGINYFGTKHMLKGCINDVHNIKKFVIEHFGFKESDMVILTDDQRDNPRRMPTHENILKAMKWLVTDARMNDSFFFHYSGHGSTVESKTGDEIDGNDETICPVDFESKGQIIDDVMNAIMVRPLPRGARLTAIFDCCHSASALDLPFKYNHLGKLKNEKALSYVGKGLASASGLYMKGDLVGALKGLAKSAEIAMTGDQKLEKARKEKSTLGDAIMFSGCKDDQTSADTKIAKVGSNKPDDLAFTGAMSHALITSMNENPHQTYVQLLQNVRKRLEVKYTQVPQLSTGRLMDVNTIFIM